MHISHVPDSELADQEIIVVAHWPESTLEDHGEVLRDVVFYGEIADVRTHTEVHTILSVDRVIKDNIKTGLKSLLVHTRLVWCEIREEEL